MGFSTTTRWRNRAILAVALGLMLVVIPGNLAAGDEGDDGDSSGADVVLLHLDGDASELVYLPTDGDPLTQPFLLDGCEATLDDTGSVLMTIAPIPEPPDGAVGLFKGLGVITEGRFGTGPACGRVDGLAEGLVFALAGDLADKTIEAAEIDIEARRSVTVVGELFSDGVKVGEAELVTATADPIETESGYVIEGNYRWLIDEGVGFDELVLTVSPSTPTSSFSVESGFDGTPPGELGYTETVFQLSGFDGTVGCGGETTTVGDAEETPMAVFKRGENNVAKGGDPDCEASVGFTLGSSASEEDQTVTFEFETSELPSWWGTFTWAPEPAEVPVPATEIDADSDGTVDGDIGWCDGFETDEGGEPIIDEFTGLPIPVMPEAADWCLVSQGADLLGGGLMQVTQLLYGQSDPSFARPR